jgi:hypothetical protein
MYSASLNAALDQSTAKSLRQAEHLFQMLLHRAFTSGL